VAYEDDHPDEHPHAGGARTKLMEEVAQQMDAIEADFGDEFEILRVLTIVMVKRPDGDAGLRIRNMDMSPLEAVGLLSMAQDVLKAQAATYGDDDS
jgi:hypothetical protein